jgi:hypothetical protein
MWLATTVLDQFYEKNLTTVVIKDCVESFTRTDKKVHLNCELSFRYWYATCNIQYTVYNIFNIFTMQYRIQALPSLEKQVKKKLLAHCFKNVFARWIPKIRACR